LGVFDQNKLGNSWNFFCFSGLKFSLFSFYFLKKDLQIFQYQKIGEKKEKKTLLILLKIHKKKRKEKR